MAVDPLEAIHYGVKVMYAQTSSHTNTSTSAAAFEDFWCLLTICFTSFNPVSLTSAFSVGAGLR